MEDRWREEEGRGREEGGKREGRGREEGGGGVREEGSACSIANSLWRVVL